MGQCGIGLYVKNSVEAVRLYQTAFGWELGYNVRNDDGSFFHSELCENGEARIAVVESDAPAPENNPVELGVTFDCEEELRKAFGLLKDGGCVLMDVCELPWSPCAAGVTDKFGVRWYLTVPQHRPPDTFVPSDYT